jgi:restriction system protein
LWDDLFEALRWLFSVVHPAWSILVAAVFFLIPVIWFHHSVKVPQLQIFGYILGAVPAIISLAAGFAGSRFRQERAVFLQQHLDIAWLNNLSWQDFERQVAEVYRQQGYWVDEVGGGGADGGVDLRLRRDGTTVIVQCKRWKTFMVGVKPVRELFGVMTAEKADRAIFITSGIYTDEALRFAEGKPLELVDGAQLAEMLRQFQSSMRRALTALFTTLHNRNPIPIPRLQNICQKGVPTTLKLVSVNSTPELSISDKVPTRQSMETETLQTNQLSEVNYIHFYGFRLLLPRPRKKFAGSLNGCSCFK